MTIAALPCVHHWVIEGQRGPVSDAQCRKCYAERTFPTPYSQSSYDKERPRFPKILIRRTEDWDD